MGARILIQYIIINIILAPWPVTLTGTVRYHFVEAVDWGLIDGVAPVRLKCVGQLAVALSCALYNGLIVITKNI